MSHPGNYSGVLTTSGGSLSFYVGFVARGGGCSATSATSDKTHIKQPDVLIRDWERELNYLAEL